MTKDAEIKLLRAIVADACEVLRHYDLPEHAYHYERVLAGKVKLSAVQPRASAPIKARGADPQQGTNT